METTKAQPKEACIISHTHWDREWYKPFQGYRFYLVKLIDEAMNLTDTDPDFHYFHLDGQTVVIEDYAEIKPEGMERLKAKLRKGDLQIGPWYDLPDVFLVDQESLVRNLQLGHEQCRQLGTKPMPAGYTVDLFGHSSQMPQIYAGFGIRAATLFRGIEEELGSEFTWVGADGTECLVINLDKDTAYSDFWYMFMAILCHRKPYDEEEVKAGLEKLIERQAGRTVTPYLLFMDGVDHMTANPRTSRILKDARRWHPELRFIHASWPQYLEKVQAYLKGGGVELPKVHGELRVPSKTGNLNKLHQDCGSSRIYLKIQNKYCETDLIRWWEPLRASLGALGFHTDPGYLLLAWKYVLKNHPHDSICGCSIDQVHKDMEYRFDQARLIAAEAVDELLRALGERVDTRWMGEGERGLLVCNPSQYERRGVVRLKTDVRFLNPAEPFALVTRDGAEVPYQIISKHEIKGRIYYYQTLRTDTGGVPLAAYELALDMKDLPAMGYQALRLAPTRVPHSAGRKRISEEFGVMENDHLKVEFDESGRLNILHKATGRSWEGLHDFEDGGEVGSLWDHKSPAADHIVRGVKSARIAQVTNGLLMATYRVSYVLELPAAATPDYAGRDDRMVEQPVVSDFTLTRDAQFVSVQTVIDNKVRDHRLRVIFPTDVKTDTHHGSSQFDVVERAFKLRDTTGWKEQDTPTKPTTGFFGVSDGKVGLDVITYGLPEYSAYDDERRTLGLTLIKALPFTVGTEGEEGPECLRSIRFNYAICPHAGTWEDAGMFRLMDQHNLEPRAVMITAHEGQLPARGGFLAVEPEGLILSSLRNPYGNDQDMVLRLYNPSTHEVRGRVKLELPFAKAFECNLNDEPLGELAVKDEVVQFTLGPKKIKSIRYGGRES